MSDGSDGYDMLSDGSAEVSSRDRRLAETAETAKLLEDWLAAEAPPEDLELTVPPQAPVKLARYIADLMMEQETALKTRRNVEEAAYSYRAGPPKDIGTYVQLVVGGGVHRAWTFKFPVNFAIRYLRVLAVIWLQSIERRYKEAVGLE